MAIKQFSVGASKTVNLGDYNSVRVEASIVYELAEGDDYYTQRERMMDALKSQLEATYKSQMAKREPAK